MAESSWFQSIKGGYGVVDFYTGHLDQYYHLRVNKQQHFFIPAHKGIIILMLKEVITIIFLLKIFQEIEIIILIISTIIFHEIKITIIYNK